MERTICLAVLPVKRLLGIEMIDKSLLEEMELELNLKLWSTDWGRGVHFGEGAKATLGFSNSLGGLTEFSKAAILTVTLC